MESAGAHRGDEDAAFVALRMEDCLLDSPQVLQVEVVDPHLHTRFGMRYMASSRGGLGYSAREQEILFTQLVHDTAFEQKPPQDPSKSWHALAQFRVPCAPNSAACTLKDDPWTLHPDPGLLGPDSVCTIHATPALPPRCMPDWN